MSKTKLNFKLGVENAEQLKRLQKDFSYINELLLRIAILQTLIDESKCLKCKISWLVYGENLVHEFQDFTYLMMNK